MKNTKLKLMIALAFVGASAHTIAAETNLIQDPQFSEFRANQSKSDVWVKVADKKAGKGDAGSSKDTAFDDEGSVRLRFVDAKDDFSATPGITQTVSNVEANSDYTLSLYYYDSKGDDSISQLEFGVQDASGKVVASKKVHVKELANSPQGAVKKGFRQVSLDLNSGANTALTFFAKLHTLDPSKIDSNGDIGKQTEVRLDDIELIKK